MSNITQAFKLNDATLDFIHRRFPTLHNNHSLHTAIPVIPTSYNKLNIYLIDVQHKLQRKRKVF